MSYKNRFTAILFFEIIMVLTAMAVLMGIDVFAKEETAQNDTSENVAVYNETQSEPTTVAVSNFSGNSFLHPLKSGRISSHFGIRNDPFDNHLAKHEGTDIAAPKGTEIIAAAGGTVSYIGYDDDGYGKYFKISHSEDVLTLYAHCSEILVEKGQQIKAGEVVALVGSTGQSTGNHLHFEIRIKGKAVNAMWYLGEQ
ncbi:MAG: M23 family metallopeptidase [Ruminococcaceae bacterium]|nr:M23 family metallopeptidase [Oscillospiraceae bacterium]